MSYLKKYAPWLLLLAALLLRLPYLTADAPGYLDSTGFLVTDEGWYAGAAARAHLGIAAVEGDLNTVTHTPLFHLWSSLAFRLLGVALHSVRLLNILAAGATVGALLLLPGRHRRLGLVAAGLLALDYTHIMFSRIGGTEPLMALLATLSLLAFAYAEERPVLHAVGMLAAVAVGLTKANGLLFIGVYLTALAIAHYSRSADLRSCLRTAPRVLVVPLAVAGLSLAAWWQFWVLPNYADWSIFNAHTITARLPESLPQLARNLTAFVALNPLAENSYLLLLLGAGGLAATVRQLLYKEQVPRAVVYAAVWTAALTMLYMPYNYQPERYFVLYLPALALLASYWIRRLAEAGTEAPLPMKALAAVTTWVLASKLLRLQFLDSALAVLFLGAAVAALYALRREHRRLAATLIGLAAAILLLPYFRWVHQPRFTVATVAALVEREVRADSDSPCLLGNVAATLALVNRLPTMTTTYGEMRVKWSQCPPTHLLVSDREYQKLLQKVPGLDQNVELIGRHFIYQNYKGEAEPGERLLRIRPGYTPFSPRTASTDQQ